MFQIDIFGQLFICNIGCEQQTEIETLDNHIVLSADNEQIVHYRPFTVT